MKKRLLAGLLAAAMLTGLGSVVFAGDGDGTDEMLDNEINAQTQTGEQLGTVEDITGGVPDNNSDPRKITINANEVLTFSASNESTPRYHWWVGCNVIAPTDVTLSTSGAATATYKSQQAWEDGLSEEKDFDGEKGNWDVKQEKGGSIQLWIPVQPWYFERYAKEGNIKAQYVFTWTKDGSPQTIEFIIPSTVQFVEAPVSGYKDGEIYIGYKDVDALVSGNPGGPVDGCAFKGEGITVSKVTFDPAEKVVTKKVGDEVVLSAKGYFTQNNKDFEVYEPEITWEIKDGDGNDVTSTEENGVLTLAEGDVGKTLTVTPACTGVDAANITGSLTITVEKADDPVYTVEAAASPASVEQGGNVELTATVAVTPEGASTEGTYAWTVKKGEDPVTGLTVDATANPTVAIPINFAAGDYTFTVTFTPKVGGVAADDVAVKVTEKAQSGGEGVKPTLKSIAISPKTATVEQGKTQTFTVTATDNDGKPFELPKLNWDIDSKTSSIKDGVLMVAKDEAAATLTVTAIVDGNNAIFDSATVTVKKSQTTTPGGNGGGSGSGSSGGGSSSGSGSTSAAPKTETTTVTETSAATQTTKAVEQAIAKAEKADAATATATVKVQNAKSISAKALESMVKAAEKAAEKKDTEVNLVLHADVVKNGKVESRLYIDPTKATLKSDLKLGVTLGDQKVEKKFDKYFDNKIAVVKFDQVGTFGMNIKAAVKADLKGMNTRNLHFYSYDAKTNTYVKLANPKYWVDANGYLHFTTSQGNYVVVTDAPLVRK